MDITETVKEIEKDIQYFSNMEFNILSSKFARDLKLIQTLVEKINTTNNIEQVDK